MFFSLTAIDDIAQENTPNIINLHTVNIRNWLKNPNNVYIGRQTPQLEGSKWGNPYLMSAGYSRPEVIVKYEKYVQEKKELRDSVYQLTGKSLGCWCSPQRCHAEILHRLAGNNPVY